MWLHNVVFPFPKEMSRDEENTEEKLLVVLVWMNYDEMIVIKLYMIL